MIMMTRLDRVDIAVITLGMMRRVAQDDAAHALIIRTVKNHVAAHREFACVKLLAALRGGISNRSIHEIGIQHEIRKAVAVRHGPDSISIVQNVGIVPITRFRASVNPVPS